MRQDSVLGIDAKVLFQGRTEETVEWLESHQTTVFPNGPLWVSVGVTGDLLTSSEYLDLAT